MKSLAFCAGPLVALLLLMGCSKSLEEGIIGEYQFEGRLAEGGTPGQITAGTPQMNVKFNADKTVVSPSAPNSYRGTWSMQGDILTMDFAGQSMKGIVRHGGKEIEITELGGAPTEGRNRLFLVRL